MWSTNSNSPINSRSWPRRLRQVAFAVASILGVCLVSDRGGAQTYARMSAQAGHPASSGFVPECPTGCDVCFQFDENQVFPQPTDPNDCNFTEGTFQWWVMNPFTKNLASTVNTYFEGVVHPDQSICFRAFSWTRHGVLSDAYWFPDLCKVATTVPLNYTAGPVDVDVPNYGNMQVLAGFEVLANFVTPAGTRLDGITWNYD